MGRTPSARTWGAATGCVGGAACYAEWCMRGPGARHARDGCPMPTMHAGTPLLSSQANLQGTTTVGPAGDVTFTFVAAPDKVGRGAEGCMQLEFKLLPSPATGWPHHRQGGLHHQGAGAARMRAHPGAARARVPAPARMLLLAARPAACLPSHSPQSTTYTLQIDHKDPSDYKPVHLIGSEQAVDACKALVAEVMENEHCHIGGPANMGGETSRMISCPPGIVGRVIGRGGETIRSLQSGSGAHILVDQVRGGAGGGGGAGAQKAAGLRWSRRVARCGAPVGCGVGRVLPEVVLVAPLTRPSGSWRPANTPARALRRVPQNFPPEQNREITISGKADAVDRAYQMVSTTCMCPP